MSDYSETHSPLSIHVYDTVFEIPKAFKRHYCHENLYPEILPGVHCFDDAEQLVQAFILREYFPEGGVFVDIGASCGVYSYLASTKNASAIYGFEPIPELCNFYRKNVPGAICYNVALTDDITVPLFIGKFGTNQINATEQGAENRVQIKTDTLDNYGIAPDFMKIDVEGMAGKVLSGGIETLKKTQVAMIEIHGGEAGGMIETMLKDFGFQMEMIAQNHLMAIRSPLKPPANYNLS